MRKILQIALLFNLGLNATGVFSAPLNISQTPLFLTDAVAPLTMLVVSRDHKLYFEAYNDASDVNGNGQLDIHFNPSIDYYGYFDSYKCYGYSAANQYFFPTSVTASKRCSGSWSGNFLNYLTTARLDAIRKVLYGGYRAIDLSNQTIIQRTYIPQDGHSWGKEYSSAAIDGYNISDYTPFSSPSSGWHLFANTTLRNGSAAPLLRVALNQPYRIWEWVSIERPVAGARAMNGSNGPLISGITDYVVRVKVCDPVVGLESNCRVYPNGSYKPIGLLQEFGENNSMMFGLITGSYNNNLEGGVLRKNISSIQDEIDLNTGQFTAVNGIISTLNKLTVTGFQTDYTYSCGFIATRNINNGECQMWGNPVGEMMYEATRYFAGKNSPTPAYNYSGGTDAALGLPLPGWQNPYSNFPRCSTANMLVLSDLYPNYDSNAIPGSAFNSFSGDLSGLSVASLGQSIFSSEGFSSLLAFIGQSGSNADGAPTPKTVTSFGNIRGLAPHEPNSEGSFYSASVSWYALLTDLNSASDSQTVRSYIVALASPQPDFSFNVGGKTVRIIPFGKSVSGYGISPALNAYQPTNEIVDYFIEQISPTSAIFRISFADLQQGGDFDMDAIVIYTVTVNPDNTITIALDSHYAAGSIVQHLGYVISGTTQDGVYLEVRDQDTSEASDPDYYLDTPPGQLPGQNWQDGTFLPLTASRTFTPSANPAATMLKSPLWYAAKWGGFDDLNNNGKPDSQQEWDKNNDGNPDNYFLINNATTLAQQLATAFSQIIDRTGSFSSAALSSGFLANGTHIYQAVFRTDSWSGQLLAYALDPFTGDVLTNGTGPNGSIWDAGAILDIKNPDTGRRIITIKPSTGAGIPFRWPINAASPGLTELDLSQVSALNISPVSGVNDGLGEQRLLFLRGYRSSEQNNGGTFRNRHSVLGDIINSAPISVSNPIQAYPSIWLSGAPENAVSYQSFQIANKNRRNVIYVGANDGMLHAFDGETGSELFAYVPSVLFSKLPALTNPDYSHQYYVDGSPTVIDAFLGGQWRTVLAAGLNGGGQAIYALDITDPNQFNEASAPSIVKWEFTDADDADLGYTYSQPAIVRLNNGKWAAIFGNGYNNTVTDGHVSSTGNAVLYIVDLETKAIIKKLDSGVGMADDPLGLGRPNGMASPTVVDLDGNSTADRVYVGDLFGNLWKIDISTSNVNQWDFSFKSGNTPLPLFTAVDSGGNPQPITSRPAVSRVSFSQSIYQVYFGTGKYLEASDKTDTGVQSVYALRDDNSGVITSRLSLRQQTILAEDASTRITSNNLLANNDRGWYLDLIFNGVAKGERVVSDMIYLNGKIIFTTIIPTADPCDFGGESWLMELNALTGSRLNYNVFDLNKDGVINGSDGGSYDTGTGTISTTVSGMKSEVGLISTPAIISAGDKEYKYLSGSSGGIQKVNENPGSQLFGRQSWKQLK